MKIVLLFIAFIYLNLSYGQTGLISYSADLPMADSLTEQIPEVQNSDYAFYFRVYLSGQTVDIFSADKHTFQGIITNTIREYEQIKTEDEDEYQTKASKIHRKQTTIESSLATRIGRQIIASGQFSIPTDTLISSWTRWILHCDNVVFEIKNEDNYVKQSFHCPWIQPDSIAFKETILSNYNLVHDELELDSVYADFVKLLPKGKTYSSDGYGMVYIMTDKQEKAFIKDTPRRDYLKAIKDSVDSYLTTQIAKQKISFKELNCFEDYYLTFNTRGILKKIEISDYDQPKLFDGLGDYLEDKREIRKCKKLIQKIFIEIDLKSFDLKHEVYRTLNFYLDGEILLRDDTYY